MTAREFDNATIALAMELRSAGIRWKLLERCLGTGICNAVHCAKKTGMR